MSPPAMWPHLTPMSPPPPTIHPPPSPRNPCPLIPPRAPSHRVTCPDHERPPFTVTPRRDHAARR
eukprot:4659584-Prymnesium_polylepis.1